jgi:hypothetical protein
MKTKFVWTCEDVFFKRLVNQNENTRFSNWRAFPACKKILDDFKGLGDLNNVPVVPHGHAGGKANTNKLP